MARHSRSGSLAGRIVLAVLVAGHLAGPGGSSLVLAAGDEPDSVIFQEDRPPSEVSCLTEDQRLEIKSRIQTNLASLQSQGTLLSQTESVVLLDWPLAPWNGLSDYGYHGISNFVDQDPNYPDALLDYNCGDRTYDRLSGYNHKGIDIFPAPFGWAKMYKNKVAILSMAAGTIIFKQDGFFDQSCAATGGDGNAVYVVHDDGSVAWYIHMKRGSTTSKSVGQRVVAGEYLGIVGSSGNSTGPHLHLEMYDSGGDLMDPYAGPCNYLNSASPWKTQAPYYDSAVTKVMTGKAPPESPPCPAQEITNQSTRFDVGDPIYFTTSFRDQLQGQQIVYSVFRPDGTLYSSWTRSSTQPHLSASTWIYGFNPFRGTQEGTWSFEVLYEGVVYRTSFIIGEPSVTDVVVTHPSDNGTVDCRNIQLRGSRPVVKWDRGNYDRFRAMISGSPNFPKKGRITSGKQLIGRATWRPSRKQWFRMCRRSDPNLYIRVMGVDLDVGKGNPDRRNLSNVVHVIRN